MKTNNLDNRYASIPADMFTPVNKDRVLTDQKFDTKPVGYLTDAWRRFKKNKGAVIASFIILIIVLFAIIKNYLMIAATTPEPTVLPPSRIAKRRPSSIAIGVISLIVK